jgi:CMP-N,N'-diacetyllegionaminic acid synthase
MKILVVIPARGGSKGIPRKNCKILEGKPLIHYSIEAAQKLFSNKQILVSTDDEEIKICAEQTGISVPFLRPAELATDLSGSYEVLLHALEFEEARGNNYDVLVLLQPTSPFRNETHILEALQLYTEELDMIVSVKEAKSNPYYGLVEENEAGYLEKSKPGNFTRRQDAPKVWEYNGAIYIINVNSLKKNTLGEFKKVKKYIMDDVSSHDLDTQFDWMIAELLISIKNEN